MGTVAKINQADLLVAFKARLIERIPDLGNYNTHFADDPNEFMKQRPDDKFACVVSPQSGDYDDSFNVSTCEISEKTHTVVGIYTREETNDAAHIDNKMVVSKKSMIRYWKPTIMAAILTETDQSQITNWMPKTPDGKDMLKEDIRIVRCQGPQQGPYFDLWMQIAFFTHFKWELRNK